MQTTCMLEASRYTYAVFMVALNDIGIDVSVAAAIPSIWRGLPPEAYHPLVWPARASNVLAEATIQERVLV